MRCPKCQSKETKRVSVSDSAWSSGHQRCNDCGHQEHWGAFCDPPLSPGLFPTGRVKVVIE